MDQGQTTSARIPAQPVNISDPWWLVTVILVAAGSCVAVLASPETAIGLVLAVMTAVLFAWKPQILVGLYPAMLLVFPPMFRGISGASTGIRIDQLLLAAAVLSVGFLVVIRRQVLPVNHLLAAYGFYYLSLVVSNLYAKFALGIEPSSGEIFQLMGQLRPLLIMGVFMLLLNSERRIWIAIWSTVAGGIFAIVFGLAQYAGIGWVRLATLAFYNRKSELDPWHLFLRITSTFDGMSNVAAAFGYIFGSLLLGMLLVLPARHRKWSLPILILLLIDLVFLMGTASRGGIGGAVFAGGILLIMIGKKRVLFSVLGILTAVSAFALTVMPALQYRAIAMLQVLFEGASTDVVISYREELWQAALNDYILPSPVLGSGAVQILTDSQFYSEMAQRGALGILVLVFMLLVVGRTGFLTWRYSRKWLGQALGFCVLFSTMALGVQSIAISIISGHRPLELYWMLVAAMWFYYPFARRTPAAGSTDRDTEEASPSPIIDADNSTQSSPDQRAPAR